MSAPLCDMLSNHSINFHIYADDTQLYKQINHKSEWSEKFSMVKCISEIKAWMTTNKLKFNDKTLMIIFGNSFQLSKTVTKCHKSR